MVLVVWLQDEKFDPLRGPSISDLVAKETVDKLTYMGWELDQAADPKKVLYHLTLELCTERPIISLLHRKLRRSWRGVCSLWTVLVVWNSCSMSGRRQEEL